MKVGFELGFKAKRKAESTKNDRRVTIQTEGTEAISLLEQLTLLFSVVIIDGLVNQPAIEATGKFYAVEMFQDLLNRMKAWFEQGANKEELPDLVNRFPHYVKEYQLGSKNAKIARQLTKAFGDLFKNNMLGIIDMNNLPYVEDEPKRKEVNIDEVFK